MAAEVWPRLAARSSGHLGGSQIFLAAANAVLKVAMYPPDDFDIEDEDLEGFRSGIAEDAMAACLKELGSSLISFIANKIAQSSTWQEAEVCLYSLCLLSQPVTAMLCQSATEHSVLRQEQNATAASLAKLFREEAGGSAVLDSVTRRWPQGKLVNTGVTTIKGFAKWIALDATTIERSMNYTLAALAIPKAKASASEALRELCQASAPHLAAARAISSLMGACESVITTSLGGMEAKESITLVGGLAAVAAALPLHESEATITSLTASAVVTINELSTEQENTPDKAARLASALKVMSTVLEFGAASNAHPAVPCMQSVWPGLGLVATNWSSDPLVAAALCELWGTLASKLGVMMQNVIPEVVAIVQVMFKHHLVSAAIDCLSSIVALSSEEVFTAALSEVAAALGTLETLAETQTLPGRRAMECLGAIYRLARTCLRRIPSFAISSLLAAIYSSGLGALSKGDSEVAVNAASFLSETINGGSMNETEAWSVSSETAHRMNAIVCPTILPLVEIVLKLLAAGQVTPAFKEALIDILYALVQRHPGATEAAIISSLNSSSFPVRPGVLDDAAKRQFLRGVMRKPCYRRKMFQELASDFSRVCQAHSPAEVLFEY